MKGIIPANKNALDTKSGTYRGMFICSMIENRFTIGPMDTNATKKLLKRLVVSLSNLGLNAIPHVMSKVDSTTKLVFLRTIEYSLSIMYIDDTIFCNIYLWVAEVCRSITVLFCYFCDTSLA